jgi:8-hydroxy-5-deazaflavin:NADPH oxidoreductase
MKIGILGTGVVGQTIGTKLVSLGHDVKMGARAVANEKAEKWMKENGARATHGTFADAAAFGEIIFNCTSGMASLDALRQAGARNLDGKILIDVANPLDFSKGMPPTLSVCNTDSLGDITTARGTEMLLPIWLRLWSTFKTPNINFHIAHP